MLTTEGIPHRSTPLKRSGAPLNTACAAVVLLHGRGATADSILEFDSALAVQGVAYLAPQAEGSTWYPRSFLAPLSDNQPYLAGALSRIDAVVDECIQNGLPEERIIVMGFSQGACLALEYAARFGRSLGGAIALSGGLIGTGQLPGAVPPEDKKFDYPGRLSGLKVFMGSGDVDAHIPLSRFQRSQQVLASLGAEVDCRIYAGMGHTVTQDEVDAARLIVAQCCGKEAGRLP